MKGIMMEIFNVFGLIFTVLMLLPNIIFAIKCKNEGSAPVHKGIAVLEQIGRFGCIFGMTFFIPHTWWGWWSDEAFAMYLIVNSTLVLGYCIFWVVLWKKRSLFRALVLSVLPSLIFLFSGIMSRSVLLSLFALLFAPVHILISCKSAQP